MIKIFDTLQQYNNYTEDGIKSGIIYYVKEDGSIHFYTNNIDGEAKVYNGGNTESLSNDLKGILERSITEIDIPKNVTKIDNNAFKGCYNLSSVTIPDGLTWIGNEAFANCFALTNINIPDSVDTIAADAFNKCNSLPTVNNIRYADNYLISPTDKTLTSYTIKDTTEWIGDSAFIECTNLQNITIPDSVTRIGNYAFYGCTNLKSIVIPNGVKEIPTSAFQGCTSLTSVTIGSGVSKISMYAFEGCSALTNIISLATKAPTINASSTFKNIKTGGTLTVPSGSTGYNVWMRGTEYYLGYYNWRQVTA